VSTKSTAKDLSRLQAKKQGIYCFHIHQHLVTTAEQRPDTAISAQCSGGRRSEAAAHEKSIQE